MRSVSLKGVLSSLSKLVALQLLVTYGPCIGQNIVCDQAQICVRDLVITTCSINSPVLVWEIDTGNGSYEIDFNVKDTVGYEETRGIFSANLTKRDNDFSESVLQFRFTADLNKTSIVCNDVKNKTMTSCQVENYGNLPGSVTSITASNKTCQNVLVSWNEPSNGSTLVKFYNVSVTPATVGDGGQLGSTYAVSTSHINLTKLVFGVNYNISVSACSCAGCGLVTKNSISISGSTTELRQRLRIDSNTINYMLHNESQSSNYNITITWVEPVPDCSLEFSVKIENKTTRLYSTVNNFFTLANFSQKSAFNVSVAGVNGKIVGPYSNPALCFRLDVPGVVSNISVNLIKNGSDILIAMEWMPPVDVSCIPPVTHYVVVIEEKPLIHYNNSLLTTTTASTSQVKQITLNITAANLFGMGITTNTSISISNGATTWTSTSAIFVTIAAITLINVL